MVLVPVRYTAFHIDPLACLETIETKTPETSARIRNIGEMITQCAKVCPITVIFIVRTKFVVWLHSINEIYVQNTLVQISNHGPSPVIAHVSYNAQTTMLLSLTDLAIRCGLCCIWIITIVHLLRDQHPVAVGMDAMQLIGEIQQSSPLTMSECD